MTTCNLQGRSRITDAPGFTLATALLGLAALLYTLPENLTESLVVGQLKAQYLACSGATAAVFYHWFKSRQRVPLSPYLRSYLGAMAYMAIIAPAACDSTAFEWRVYGYDLLTMIGFVTGFLLSGMWPMGKLERLLSFLSLIWASTLLAIVAALQVGALTPVWRGSVRIHVWSMFHAMNAIVAAIPLLAVTHWAAARSGRTLPLRCAALGAVVLLSNGLAGARSILVVWGVAILVALALFLARLNKGIVIITLAVSLALVSLLAFVYDPAAGQVALGRLQRTDIQREQRLTEVEWMFDYLQERSLTGTGYGSKFPSPVRYNNEEYAAYPHVAILAPLLKGGVVGFGILVVAPLVSCLRGLSSLARNPFRYAAAASMLVYFVLASLSGGWNYPTLLYFGLATGLEWRTRMLQFTSVSRTAACNSEPVPYTACSRPF